MSALLGRVVRRARALPCKLMLATIVLCAIVRDWYPFSPFPMYAAFAPQAWYVSVTDASDRPVPTQVAFGIGAMPLRRLFETRVLALRAAGLTEPQAEARAAIDLLRFLVAEARPARSELAASPPLRLWRTVCRVEGGHAMRSRPVLLGELATQ